MEQVNKSDKKQLKGKLRTGTVALLIALLAAASATYAWYIYNTSRHTTKVRMAAGAGVNLQISNSYNGTYGSAAVLDSFSGQLNPVSTNRISGGFQKVLGFTNGTENQSNLVANLFGKAMMYLVIALWKLEKPIVRKAPSGAFRYLYEQNIKTGERW